MASLLVEQPRSGISSPKAKQSHPHFATDD
jgi:hypothetical protein